MKPSRQWPRHVVQVLVIVLIIMVAWSSWQPADRNIIPQDHTKNIYGNTWAAKIYAVSFIDPLAALESSVTHKQIVTTILIGVTIPILITLLLGRIFCSWICPAGLLFELTDKLRIPFTYLAAKPRNIHFWRGHKYVLLIVGLAMSALLATPLLCYLYPPAIIVRELHSGVYAWLDQHFKNFAISGAVIFLFAVILLEVFVARRFWCRYVCPGGGLYSLLGTFRFIRVRRKATVCTDCGDCVPICPVGLNPMQDQLGIECDNCQACISSCPEKALSLVCCLSDKKTSKK